MILLLDRGVNLGHIKVRLGSRFGGQSSVHYKVRISICYYKKTETKYLYIIIIISYLTKIGMNFEWLAVFLTILLIKHQYFKIHTTRYHFFPRCPSFSMDCHLTTDIFYMTYIRKFDQKSWTVLNRFGNFEPIDPHLAVPNW